VAVLALFANYYGRKFEALALILVAGAITSLYNPGYLTDLGWLLSFLAFFGIMVLAPAMEARLGNPKPILAKLFIESLAAQIMTIPLILFIFGQFSIISPIANLLVLPLVPLAMLVCFIAGLAGMLAPAFCGWFAWPAMLVLGFILSLVNWLAQMPWASRPLSIDAQTMVIMYLLILAGLIAMTRRNKRVGAIVKNDHLLELVRSAITTV
jgi:competence protein ComEC